MPDGSVGTPRLSMLDRAVTLDCWRAIRRRLPPDLRRALPVTPPSPSRPGLRPAQALLADVLRKRSRRRADEDEPLWRPRIADIAAAYAVDRSTIEDWLHGLDYYKRERGCLVIRGTTALRMARLVFASSPPSTMDEAIERLEADLQRRVATPRRTARWIEVFQDEEPKYRRLGSGPATIDQFAALLSDPSRRSFAQHASAGETVRQALARLERTTGLIDPEWLKTGMGQAFWLATQAAADKKYCTKRAGV